MKKSLIALAALATVATAAQAQSSVTIYGVMDPTIIYTKQQGGNSNTALSQGGAASSRFGFRGEEDLGGGLKAFFNLEGAVEADTGESSTSGLFHRASFVGLKNAVVSGQAGRMNTLDYAKLAKYDVFGGNNFGGGVTYFALSTGAANAFQADVRRNNTLQLDVTPMAGLVISAQHSFGEVAGANSNSTDSADGLGKALRANSYAIDFNTGKLDLAAIFSKQNTTTGATQYEQKAAYARYDFGVAKVVLGHLEHETPTLKRKGDYLGVSVPVGAKTTILANVAKLDWNATDKATGYGLGAYYALSKRTTAYAILAKAANEGASGLRVAGSAIGTAEMSTAAAGKDQTGYAVGVRHTF